MDFIYIADWTQMDRANYETYDTDARVAEVGSLSTGAKIAIKIFVWRVIANFLILLNMICNTYQETLLLSQKALITFTFDIWGQFERGNIR